MNEIFKTNQYKVLELFIEQPFKRFSIRAIARILKLSHPVIIKYIKELLNLKLIKKDTDTLYPTYYGNDESDDFKLYKKHNIIEKIYESGLIKHIYENTLANSIILFGSSSKAYYDEKSDIDIFVEARQKHLDLERFEKLLGKEIQLIFEKNINDLSKELRRNIVNGVILDGFVRVN